jgi:phosphoribosylformylglycinamidine synthase
MVVVGRLSVRTNDTDPRGVALLADAHTLGFSGLRAIVPVDVYFLTGALDDAARSTLEHLLVDPLLQHGTWKAPDASVVAVETTLLPGVTDTTAAVLAAAAATAGVHLEAVATGRRFELQGDITPQQMDALATRLLSNSVIERAAVGVIEPPAHHEVVGEAACSTVVVRDLDDAALAAIDRERGLALDLAELRAIADHFTAERRDPTDVELETLAQTWSEHCAHKSFRALVQHTDGTTASPLLERLRHATDTIAAPFVRSAFVGNAGIVSFVDGITVAVKAETHNHPSAIEPFGGANTGVGGVIRDVMGAAHHPVAVTDVLCFGPSDLPAAALPAGVIHPRMIREGVVAGVADYGNKIGLPTVAGGVWYDPGFTANPLVFAGCIGTAVDHPARPPLDGPHPGDLVVVLGGRTGRDGLRGATFSSATMDATTGDVAGASVQIGDPITEKLLIDLLREAEGLYTAITDCGAGGLSSAVGEMAEGVGASIDLATVPLKYAGLAPWEIWLSEAQERMVVAVHPGSLAGLDALASECGVELTVLGAFTGDGRLRVRHGEATVLDLDTGFLHDGRPRRTLVAELPMPHRGDAVPTVHDHAAALLALLGHPNIASNEAIIRRYDHEIGGSTRVRPLVGRCGDAPADGVVLAHPAALHGLAIGIGMNPWYGVADAERMAHAVVDEAIRNVVAVGADPERVVLMDNFSWGDPRRPSTFGHLVAAVDGCVAASLHHRAPFVSGKDSLNNEYVGTDGLRHSVPPTLVVHAIAHLPDADRVTTPDFKQVGSVLVLVGATRPEFGGSHLGHLTPGFDTEAHSSVPAPDPGAPARYRVLHRLLAAGSVLACHDVSEGGLAVALAEMAIGARLGIRVEHLPHADRTVALFSESVGRLVCEVAPDDVATFIAAFDAIDEHVELLGRVVAEPVIDLPGCTVALDDAVLAFTGTRR